MAGVKSSHTTHSGGKKIRTQKTQVQARSNFSLKTQVLTHFPKHNMTNLIIPVLGCFHELIYTYMILASLAFTTQK